MQCEGGAYHLTSDPPKCIGGKYRHSTSALEFFVHLIIQVVLEECLHFW